MPMHSDAYMLCSTVKERIRIIIHKDNSLDLFDQFISIEERETDSIMIRFVRCSNAVFLLKLYIHCVPKKEATKLSAITCSNLNRFSKLFHC